MNQSPSTCKLYVKVVACVSSQESAREGRAREEGTWMRLRVEVRSIKSWTTEELCNFKGTKYFPVFQYVPVPITSTVQ